MINPNDIFNAHRVVKSPDSYRRKAPSFTSPILPIRHGLVNRERRGVTIRVHTGKYARQFAVVRERIVRDILPIIRKR